MKLYEPGKNVREEKFREELKKKWGKKYNYQNLIWYNSVTKISPL